MSSKKNKKRQHLFPRLMAWIFVGLAAAQAVAAVGAFSSPEVAFAQETFNPQVSIGGDPILFDQSTAPIAKYIKSVYTYAVGAVGILAAVMLMIGGLRWILAGGNPSSIGEAKEMIFASITGMVLVLTSYIVLSQVNPALVNLGENVTSIKLNINPETAATGEYSACEWTKLDTSKEESCLSAKGTGWKLMDHCLSSNRPAGEGQFCCCPPPPAGCPEKYNIKCQACDGCQALESSWCSNQSSCKVDPALGQKLTTLREKFDKWQATEAWPPTRNHQNECHPKGTCIDLGFRNGATYSTDDIKDFREAASEAGLRVVYECLGSGCCSNVGLSNDKTNCQEFTSHISANHFSVYNN
jgi:hypothetical protein